MARDLTPNPRSRSRSPHRHSHHPHKRSRHHSPPIPQKHCALPLAAQNISRHDLSSLRPLFALYLDVQKGLDIEELAEDEVKGRWKSFVKKWNNGDLAEGWYDVNTLQKALSAGSIQPSETAGDGGDDSHDEDDFGPALPSAATGYDIDQARSRQAGAAAPSLDELRARREEADEEAREARRRQREDLRSDRRMDRKIQRERLDELVPKSDAGTRERQLEKKKEVTASNRSFAASAHDVGDVELKDNDVMGEDGLSEFKRLKQNEERKKSERELRREEVLRARRMEREEKVRVLKEKEEKTMQYLKEIAKQRFG